MRLNKKIIIKDKDRVKDLYLFKNNLGDYIKYNNL